MNGRTCAAGTLFSSEEGEVDNTLPGLSEVFDPLPGALMEWLTRKGKEGSARVHLVASTDGVLGQLIVSC